MSLRPSQLGWLTLTLALTSALQSSGQIARASDQAAEDRPEAGLVTVLEIQGPIGPATSRYVVNGLQAAQTTSRVVILRIDTPGGLDSSMRDIIRAILASSVPVVSYVSPSGARAASAGTYILYASHIAAMAPATNLGAATPVAIGGEPEPAPLPGGGATPGKGTLPGKTPATPPAAPEPGSAMERKVVNDAVAYIRGLAELRGRNAEWAEQAVRGAASLSANAALQQKVIDLIARDLPDLLERLDGREVHLDSRTVKLATRDLPLVHLRPDWRTQL